jgi:hypothetical protein
MAANDMQLKETSLFTFDIEKPTRSCVNLDVRKIGRVSYCTSAVNDFADPWDNVFWAVHSSDGMVTCDSPESAM